MSKKAETWGAIQRKWGSIVADYTLEQTKDLIRSIIEAEEGFATYLTYSVLIVLKFRWDCPDLVFPLLDEVHAMQADSGISEAEYDDWVQRAQAALRRYIGDEPAARPQSVN